MAVTQYTLPFMSFKGKLMSIKKIVIFCVICVAVLGSGIIIKIQFFPNNWAHKTTVDLKQIHKILIENTPQYIDKYPPFMQWLDAGLKKSLLLAKKVKNPAGYYYCLSYYTHGFHNPHIMTSLIKLPHKFAGMLLGYKNNKFVVQHSDTSYQRLPPVSSVLISCGGVPTKTIVNKEIIPYYYLSDLEASYNRAASHIFFDANPFRHYYATCTFQTKAGIKKYKIEWRNLSDTTETKINKKIYVSYSFGMHQFGKNGLWISIPTFEPNASGRKFLNLIISSGATLRKFNPIVYDVRGNSGGNSKWANRLLNSLYGKNFVDAAILKNDKSWSQYRLSKLNIKQMKTFQPKQYMAYMTQNQIQTAALYPSFSQYKKINKFSAPKIDKNKLSPNFKGHIYLLTDNMCLSSCLNFADIIHWLPNTTQIGWPTEGDSPYIEGNWVQLSGGAKLMYNIKIERNRPRKTNQPYIPKYWYNGDISNTFAIQSWVENLFQNNKF